MLIQFMLLVGFCRAHPTMFSADMFEHTLHAPKVSGDRDVPWGPPYPAGVYQNINADVALPWLTYTQVDKWGIAHSAFKEQHAWELRGGVQVSIDQSNTIEKVRLTGVTMHTTLNCNPYLTLNHKWLKSIYDIFIIRDINNLLQKLQNMHT